MLFPGISGSLDSWRSLCPKAKVHLLDAEILLESRVSQMIQVTVEQVPIIFHAPVFQQFGSGLHPNPGSGILDGFRIDLWILDGEVIRNVGWVHVAQPLRDMQRVARGVFRSDIQSVSGIWSLEKLPIRR